LVGFHVGVKLEGDIAIGLWFGDHKSDTDPPALAYVFHTAFVHDAGLVRVRARRLDVPTGR
jgi:hypothetical protein